MHSFFFKAPLPECAAERGVFPFGLVHSGVRWKRVAAVLVGVAVVVSATAALLGLVYGPADNVFRASEPVEGDATALRMELAAILTERIDLCGIAAPNLRVYKQLVVLRLESNEFLCMANPVATVVNKGFAAAGFEKSVMCADDNSPGMMKTRAAHVSVDYTAVNGERKRVLIGPPVSKCFGHFYAVLNGEWPCDDDGRVPRAITPLGPARP